MGETYHNHLKKYLKDDYVNYLFIKQVLTGVNYKEMSFRNFKEAFQSFYQPIAYDDNIDPENDDDPDYPDYSFVHLWAAAVAYSEYAGFEKQLVLPKLVLMIDVDTIINIKRIIITECGSLFKNFPRLAYLTGLYFETEEKIRELIKFFTDPENEKFLDFWRKANYKD